MTPAAIAAPTWLVCAVVGEQHDRPPRLAGGHDDVLQRVAGLALGVDDDHVGLQLCQPLGQKGVGRQHGDDVAAGFEQADARGCASVTGFERGGFVAGLGVQRVRCHDDDAGWRRWAADEGPAARALEFTRSEDLGCQ